jgi:predicted porin
MLGTLSAAYTYTDGHFDSSTGNLSPKWYEAFVLADYEFSRRTDLYLESMY